MELCKLDVRPDGVYEATRERIEVDPHTHLEKNWMPVMDMPFHFIRWCDPLEIMEVNHWDKSKQTVKKGTIDEYSTRVYNQHCSKTCIQRNHPYLHVS